MGDFSKNTQDPIVQSQVCNDVSIIFNLVLGVNMHNTLEWADIVIVGNGIAGLTTAVEARRFAPDTRIAIITEQCHPTINTPALKQFAIGRLTQEQLLAYPPGTERTQRIRMITARVEEINAQGKFLGLRGGYTFGYGSLIIATGSRPNGLPAHLPGRHFDGVLTLHRLQDYLDLRRRLEGVESAVVIGGGAHAIETVMSLLHHGVEVYWLIRGKSFLSHMLDHTASQMVLENARNAGAKIALKTEVTGIVGRVGSVVGVITNHDKKIPCQLVLVCTGTSPVTTLAECCTSPIMYGRGIYVDDQFRTSVRDIYAVGDVAARKHPQTGIYETQAQWYAAVLQGRSAAAVVTGHHELATQSMGVPWHATHVGDLFMLTVGNPLHMLEGATIVTDRSKNKYCRMTVIGDSLVGYLSIGTVQPDSLAIKSIIDEGLSIRRIKKALLKGEFDARKYFSQRRSQAALDMVTTGELSVVKPAYYSMTPVRSFPVVAHPPLHAPIIAAQYSQDARSSTTSVSIASAITDMNTLHAETLDKSLVVFSSLADQPTMHDLESDTRPSTGKIAAPSKQDIESILLPLPSRTVTRSLWSYSEKTPAVKARKSSFPPPEQRQSEKNNFLL
ncbi:MAG: NAD(P)/FAD-dependent oxidoreductase [Chloroflexi bacterium]|nr:MAG: NAD(P)/FAD-dependent oxidoreductase [Chloroflexota bacterium]